MSDQQSHGIDPEVAVESLMERRDVSSWADQAAAAREWERQHEGVPAKSVNFIKRFTRVPAPKEVIRLGGWDPWGEYVKEKGLTPK